MNGLTRFCLTSLSCTPIGLLTTPIAQANPVTITATEVTPIAQTPTIAQNRLPMRPMQQGSQIQFNGQTESVTWTQWQNQEQERTFISEIALTQLLGVQLLSSNNPALQPVAWYSNENQSVAQLPVRLVGTERHLDITDLAKLANWDVQVQSGQLVLNTLSAEVQNVRIGKQPWGDRVVIDLDGPVAYETEATADEFRITLTAETETPVAQAINTAWSKPPGNPIVTQLKRGTQKLLNRFLPKTAPQTAPGEDPLDQPIPKPVESVQFKRIESFKLENSPNRTVVKLGLPIAVRPRILMLNNPPRLVIDVGAPEIPARRIHWSNGLFWNEQAVNGFPVTWLEIDPRQSDLSLQPILPNQTGADLSTNPPELSGIATLIQTARQTGAIAAINGGFFNRKNQFPLGAIRVNRDWRSGPILSRGVVAWNPGGDFFFDRLTSQETVNNGTEQFNLTPFNSAYLRAGIARYDRNWGLRYSSMTDGEVIAIVRNGRVVEQKNADTVGTTIPIGTGDELLVFRSNRTGAAKFPVGTPVQITTQVQPNIDRFQHAIGGGPLLIKNGQIALDGASENFSPAFVRGLAARSAIAQTRDGKILLVAAQNTADSSGPTLAQFTQMLQQIGAVNALNLDGGSSTTLYLGGQILDRAPRSSARVHNAIGIFLTPQK